jgi:hypothetical protein
VEDELSDPEADGEATGGTLMYLKGGGATRDDEVEVAKGT